MDLNRDATTLEPVREEVRTLLMQTPAFRELAPEARRDLAHNMVKIAQYIVSGADGATIPGSAALLGRVRPPATALAGPPLQPPKFDPGTTAGEDFKRSGAIGAREGVSQVTDAINKVDFPKFVSGLIDGVFNAIVTASIKQMEAYAELVKNVAKSVDEFMKDNVSENQARDYLADRYPDHLEVDVTGESPRVKPKDGSDEDTLPDFMSDLNLPVKLDGLDEESAEEVLVPAARRRMAMDRQQLLATMVLMGINRLIVTDGTIDASVLFELKTLDKVTKNSAQNSESNQTWRHRKRQGGFFLWFSPTRESLSEGMDLKVTTSQSEESQAKTDLHVKLAGSVKVNFRSETFPLDRMADLLQVNAIQQKAMGPKPAPAQNPPIPVVQPPAAPVPAT